MLVERMLDDSRVLAHVEPIAHLSQVPSFYSKGGKSNDVGATMMRYLSLSLIIRRPFLSYSKHGHVPPPISIVRTKNLMKVIKPFMTRAGAVAAPTAGLHFDDAICSSLKIKASNSVM